MCAKQPASAQRLQRRHFRVAVRNARNRLIEQRKVTLRPHDKRVLSIQIRALFRTLKRIRPKPIEKT